MADEPQKKKVKVAPTPHPGLKDAGKTVWIACRARKGCEGQQATIVFREPSGGGGTNARYRCTTCGGAFQITT